MGNGVTYVIREAAPITVNNKTVTIKGRNYELLRMYVNRGIEHFVAAAVVGGKKIDFILKGKNALICEH